MQHLNLTKSDKTLSMLTVSTLVSVLLLTGCSAQSLYNAGQQYQKSHCVKQAINDVQLLECQNAAKVTHREYKQKLQQLEKNK